jgi:hypothetical protein
VPIEQDRRFFFFAQQPARPCSLCKLCFAPEVKLRDRKHITYADLRVNQLVASRHPTSCATYVLPSAHQDMTTRSVNIQPSLHPVSSASLRYAEHKLYVYTQAFVSCVEAILVFFITCLHAPIGMLGSHPNHQARPGATGPVKA